MLRSKSIKPPVAASDKGSVGRPEKAKINSLLERKQAAATTSSGVQDGLGRSARNTQFAKIDLLKVAAGQEARIPGLGPEE